MHIWVVGSSDLSVSWPSKKGGVCDLAKRGVLRGAGRNKRTVVNVRRGRRAGLRRPKDNECAGSADGQKPYASSGAHTKLLKKRKHKFWQFRLKPGDSDAGFFAAHHNCASDATWAKLARDDNS